MSRHPKGRELRTTSRGRLCRQALSSLCLSCFLLPALAVAQAPDVEFPQLGAPSIHTPEPSFHWGKVLEGAVIEHSYVIQNVGSELLRIERVTPG